MVRKKKEISRREALLSELASECESPEEFMDLLSDLKKSLLEKALFDWNRDRAYAIVLITLKTNA